jgi:hypothetical protein
MSTEFQEVLCDENGVGGDGEYCGDNDAQLDRALLRGWAKPREPNARAKMGRRPL